MRSRLLIFLLCSILLFARDTLTLKAEGLPDTTEVPSLGITVYTHRSDARATLDEQKVRTPSGQGVLIKSVRPNSPAANAGAKPLDIIFLIDKVRIKTAEQLATIKVDKDTLSMRWRRVIQGKWRIFDPDKHGKAMEESLQINPRKKAVRTSLNDLDPRDYPLLRTEYVPIDHATMVYYDNGGSRFGIRVSFLAMDDLPLPEELYFKIRTTFNQNELPMFIEKFAISIDGIEYLSTSVGGSRSVSNTGGGSEDRRAKSFHDPRSGDKSTKYVMFNALARTSSPVKIRLIGRSSEKSIPLTKADYNGICQVFNAFKKLGGEELINKEQEKLLAVEKKRKARMERQKKARESMPTRPKSD